jgi:hypothetical protein
MKKILYLMWIFAVLFTTGTVFAQGSTVSGKVSGSNSNLP